MFTFFYFLGPQAQPRYTREKESLQKLYYMCKITVKLTNKILVKKVLLLSVWREEHCYITDASSCMLTVFSKYLMQYLFYEGVSNAY